MLFVWAETGAYALHKSTYSHNNYFAEQFEEKKKTQKYLPNDKHILFEEQGDIANRQMHGMESAETLRVTR